MQDFLKGIKNLGTKAKSTIKDFFTVTPEEEAKGKKPNVVEKTTKSMGDFFAPAPDKVRVRDVVREIPSTAGKMAVDIARSIPRSILSTALTVAPKSVQENIGEIRPGEDFGTIGKVLLGDERIQTIPLMGQETLKGFGAGEDTAKKWGPFAGVALTAADLFPGTAGKSKMASEAFETLAKTTKPAEIKTILKSFGFAKNEIDNVTEALVKATTADDVKAVLGITDEVAPKAGKEAVEAVSRETKAPKKTVVAKATPDVTRATDEEDSMKSIGEILKGRGGDITPPAKPTAKGGKAPKGDPERRFITRTREMAPEVDELLEGKYKPKSNKELIANADEIIKKDYQAAETMARTGVDDQSVAVASKMIEDELAIAKKATDEATKNKAYAKAAEIANDAAKNLTEAGRAVQAASLLGKMTPEGMARYAARLIQQHNEKAGMSTIDRFMKGIKGSTKKIPELTSDQLKEITDAMDAINKMGDDMAKARALQQLGKKIQSYIPSTLYAKIINLWKAGLLTGLKTTGINIASNFSHAVSEIAKDVPASAVDKIVSLFTGKRTLVLTGKGSADGAAMGVKKGWDYLKTGFDERNIADKLDYRRVNFGKGKVAKGLNKYVETVFGLLGAEDQPFYYAARMRSMANQAAAKARNEGLKGKAARDFAQKLIENPTDDMMKYATLDAETAVFQNASSLAKGAQKIQRSMPGMEIVLPFAKTPANVANAMINYSPVGIAKTIIQNIGKGKFDQRLFSQGMGRGLTGTGALAIGGALMANKMMNLGFPTSEKVRQQWELEGRVPNSILINGKWRNIGVLGPLGMVLIVGGHLQDGVDEHGSFSGGLAQAAGGFGSALTEQSFLSGVNRAIDALKDPRRSFNGFASSLAGSVVPTLVADFARSMDQYERRTDGMIERIQSRIPGAREGLEPQIDTFGNAKETPNFFEVMADATRPGNPSADLNDPVIKELRRLMDEGYPATPTQLGSRRGYDSLTPEQDTYLWKLSGQAARIEMERVMRSRPYRSYDDEQKAQVLDRAVQDAKVEARARTVIQALKGLSESEQKAKLAEMKEDGLLTQSVFDLYLSLRKKR